MMTDILLEGQALPEAGVLTVQVNQTAKEAQRKVSVFVLTEIGNLLHGETPVLVIGEQAVWRVPVHLTRPSFGDLGQVGYIDVDVTSGELIFTSKSITSIERHAQALVNRLAPQAAPAVG